MKKRVLSLLVVLSLALLMLCACQFSGKGNGGGGEGEGGEKENLIFNASSELYLIQGAGITSDSVTDIMSAVDSVRDIGKYILARSELVVAATAVNYLPAKLLT